MRFADVVGHQRAVARLRRVAARDRVPAALLLFGPSGLGKRALAEAFATRLLCAAPAGDDACGACDHCMRLAHGTHPDLTVVEREEERRDMRVEQVRTLSRWLALHPLMATRKVAIIDGAHFLNEHGQNALLKTLEEPPGSSVIVLTAPAAALVLPTVRSRCQLVRLDPLPLDDVVRVLAGRGLAPERARRLAPLADGCPGRVVALDGEGEAGTRESVLDTLPRIATLAAPDISRLAQDLARGPVETALAASLGFYRDVLERGLLGAEHPLRNPDAAGPIDAAAARLPVTTVLRQLEAVCDTIAIVERNANRTLALETMLLCLREIERGRPSNPS